MAKRHRGSASFGDVNPQILTVSTGLAAAADDYAVNQVNLPVSRIGGSKTKAQVMEILRVDWFLALENALDFNSTDWGFLTTVTARGDGDLSTVGSEAADARDPLVFGMANIHRGVSTNGGMNQVWPPSIEELRLTEGWNSTCLLASI